MKRVLCIIDMQNDFITGSLGTKEAVKIVPNVLAKIDEYDLDEILVTMDTHADGYLETLEGKFLPIVHCVKPGNGWRLQEDIYKKIKGCKAVIGKPSFGSYMLLDIIDGVFESMEEDEELYVEVIGLCTDICVITNVLLLRSAFPSINIKVDASCCAGSTPVKHKAALEIMKGCCIEIINEGTGE